MGVCQWTGPSYGKNISTCQELGYLYGACLLHAPSPWLPRECGHLAPNNNHGYALGTGRPRAKEIKGKI